MQASSLSLPAAAQAPARAARPAAAAVADGATPVGRAVWWLALWLAGPTNLPLWQRLWAAADASGDRWVLLGSMGLAVFALNAALLSLIALPWLFRPAASLLVLVAAASAHFMWQYGVVIDTTMFANVSHTDTREVLDLATWSLPATLLVLAGPALWGLWRRPLFLSPWRRQLGRNALGALLSLALVLVALLSGYQSLASLMRNQKDLRYMVNPLNTVYAAGWVLTQQPARLGRTLLPLGDDAALGASYTGQARPPLLVVVVGETARARNWGLNGYRRQTTPGLARWQSRRGLVNFSDVASCGTNTQVSVPCMFSHLGREQGGDQPATHENLLDLLQRAGLAVLWLDNQSGCKGVCDRVPNVRLTKEPSALACPEEWCLDEVMLQGLDQRIQALDPQRRARGIVVVMHQAGSHGPAYFKRSPERHKPFQPECRDSALSNCPTAQVVNAYDNSIAYTDRFLSHTLGWLDRQATAGRFDTGLIYVSDHGESLGENGLYLHGLPYAIAPREQTRVPMVSWMSAGLQRRIGVSSECLRHRATAPLSHDNLFHSVLGVMDVDTRVRERSQNLFAPCAPGLPDDRHPAG